MPDRYVSRHRTRAELARSADRKGYVLIAGCVVLVGGVMAGAVLARPSPRDNATGCIKNQKVAHLHVVVADRTDPWSPPEARVLGDAVKAVAENARAEERLMVVAFDGRGDEVPKPVFDRCKLPQGKEASELVSNTAKLDREFAKHFGVPLDKAVAEVTRPANQPETHLVAFLGNLAAALKYQGKADAVTLHVFSDMGHNNSEGTLLSARRKAGKSGPPVWDAKGFSDYVGRTTNDRLKGVRLEVRVVPTAASKGSEASIRQAWEKALADAGALVSWRSL